MIELPTQLMEQALQFALRHLAAESECPYLINNACHAQRWSLSGKAANAVSPPEQAVHLFEWGSTGVETNGN